MASKAARATAPLLLVHGDDEFAVKQQARQRYDAWCAEVGGEDHEIIDSQVSNSGEALKALARLREALQTLPFFGGGKVVWLQSCNFMGDERTATTQAVTESLAELAQELKVFGWENVRLVISSGKVDKRRTFYKTLEKLGEVRSCVAWSLEEDRWIGEAEAMASGAIEREGKEIGEEALALLIHHVGPNSRLLASEVEKLCLYVGTRKQIRMEDVDKIITRQKQARSFALAEALGDRDLPRVLRVLDEELWSMKVERKRREIGLLYGLISKVRTLLVLKELVRRKWVRPGADFSGFKLQLQRVPADSLPQDKRLNPLQAHPYMLFKALPQVGRYSFRELVGAMALLLDCNRRLVTSQLDEALVLQQTLIQIIRGADGLAGAGRTQGRVS